MWKEKVDTNTHRQLYGHEIGKDEDDVTFEVLLINLVATQSIVAREKKEGGVVTEQ